MTYTVERTRWSNRSQRFVRFRLTYRRTWMDQRELWRDFLVQAEELEEFAEQMSSDQELNIEAPAFDQWQ